MTGGASESVDMKAGVRAGRFQLIFFNLELYSLIIKVGENFSVQRRIPNG